MSAVPADPSSAAFALVAALIVPGSDIMIESVMTNPLRAGLFQNAARNGRIDRNRVDVAAMAAKNVADLRVRASALKGVEVPAPRAPTMIDEYPILAVAAALRAKARP